MKIGINARFLQKQYSGIGQHTFRLLQEYEKMNLPHEFYLFVPEKLPENITFSAENFHLVIVPEKYNYLGSGFAKFWWEHSLLPAACEKLKIDLFHSFYEASSIFTQKYPVISTIHDTIPWKLPSYKRKWQTRLRLSIDRWGLKKCDKIITVSINTKLDVAALLDVPFKRILVLPNGVAGHFTPELSLETREFVKKRFSINKPFIFYLGGFDKRKNVKRLIEAFSILTNEKGFSDHNLIIGGSISVDNPNNLYYEPAILNAYARELGLKDKVKFVGSLADNEVAAFYKMCSAFVYPSLFEGFGIPVAESFACVTPVVTSYTGAMMEVAKNGAIFVDPFSPESIADGISEVLRNQNLASKISINGKELVKVYDWKRVAAENIRIYESIKVEWDQKSIFSKAKKSSTSTKNQKIEKITEPIPAIDEKKPNA